MLFGRSILFVSLLLTIAIATADKPNILFIFTDDQDIVLGSLNVMPKLKKLVTDQGAYFQNAFATTPICCPSRAEVQTGRYMHNTKVDNNGCGGTQWQAGPEKQNLAAFLRNASYRTYYSGKYLNNYGSPSVGGTAHIPVGWTDWHALVGNSKYYNYDVSDNGVKEHYGSNYATDYYTDKLKNDSDAFLASWDQKDPFMMMIGTPCPHVPNIFAPQYANNYSGVKAPRTPNWNVAPATATGPKAKHWFLQNIGPMDPEHVNNSDLTFGDRWRCLQSVDDLVEKLVTRLDNLGQLNNTYIMYSADHGQHLGQWGMGFDKRNLYETDIRVPLLVRGPGIQAGQNVTGIAAHIDLAPTILDMAGIPRPSVMDGTSWLPLVKGPSAERKANAEAWRHDFLIEYNGPTIDADGISYTNAEWFDITEQALSVSVGTAKKENPCGVGYSCNGITLCGGEHGTCPCDAKNNTYKCLRTINETENSIYCVFNDDVRMVEYYDLNADPFEMNNMHESGDPGKKAALSARLKAFMECYGADCFNPPAHPPVRPCPSSEPHRFSQGGKFLSCGSCDEAASLVLVDEEQPGTCFGLSIDALQHGQVQSGEMPSQCFNILDGDSHCAEGTVVHMHQCQEDDKKDHVGNHFHFDASQGSFVSEACPGFCVVANNKTAALSKCGNAGTTGWKSS